MNKKGMFFTILVIVILSLFFVTYTFYTDSYKRQTNEERVSTMNSFLFSIEKDLPRQLYISGFRTIFLIEKEVIEQGSYISDPNTAFNNAFFNGEINGEFQEVMLGATFSDIQGNIQEKSSKLNINTTLSNPQLSVTQTDPWNVELTLTLNLFMQDQNNLASWNKTENFVALVPIKDFEDPLYVINTNGIVTNKIQESPYTTFVTGNDISNLLDHAQNSYYIASSSAPSFIDRLQGLTSADENGIESIVNIQGLSSQGIQTSSKSVVDYIYFSSSNPSACNVQPSGMPSWFRLDSEHLDTYQVQCA